MKTFYLMAGLVPTAVLNCLVNVSPPRGLLFGLDCARVNLWLLADPLPV